MKVGKNFLKFQAYTVTRIVFKRKKPRRTEHVPRKIYLITNEIEVKTWIDQLDDIIKVINDLLSKETSGRWIHMWIFNLTIKE